MRDKKFLILLLASWLAIQCIGWFLLSRQLPYATPGVSHTWHETQAKLVRTSSAYGFNRAWHGALTFDLDRQTWFVPSGYNKAFEALETPKYAQYWRIDWDSIKEDEPTTIELVDRTTGQVMKRRVVARPCRVIHNRWAAYADNRLQWLDLEDPNSDFQELAEPDQLGYAIWADYENYVVLQRQTPATTTSPGTCALQVIRFDESNGPQYVAEWPTYVSDMLFKFCSIDDTIVTIDAAKQNIEFRRLTNGKVIMQVAIPATQVLDISWSLSRKVIHIQTATGWMNYDVAKRAWLDSPENSQLVNQLPDGSLQLYHSPAHSEFLLYDAEQKQIRFRLPSDHYLRLIDKERTVGLNEWQFTDFRYYSNTDGRLIKTWSPFRLVPLGYVGLMASFILWSILWMRTSAHVGWWAWVDVLLVLGLPMAFLSYRCASTGPGWEITRLPYQYIAGGSIAIMTLCSLWIVFGRARWILRLLPLLVAEAAVVLICRLVLDQQLDIVWRAMATVNVPVVLVVCALALMRCVGWKLSGKSSTQSQEPQHNSIRIGDLFLLTICMALILAAAGSSVTIVKGIPIGVVVSDVVSIIIGVSLLLATIIATFSKSRTYYRLSLAVCGAILLGLCIEPTTRVDPWNQ